MCRDTAVSVVSVLHANSVHLCNKQGNMKIVCLVVEPPCDAVVPVCNCDIDRSNSLLSGQIKVDVIQAEPAMSTYIGQIPRSFLPGASARC